MRPDLRYAWGAVGRAPTPFRPAKNQGLSPLATAIDITLVQQNVDYFDFIRKRFNATRWRTPCAAAIEQGIAYQVQRNV